MSAPLKPQADRHEIEAYLEEKRRAVTLKPTAELVDEVLLELQRQLEPLLATSRLRILDDEQLDRMIRINGAVLAIHRALGPAEFDPTTATEAELRKAAKS